MNGPLPINYTTTFHENENYTVRVTHEPEHGYAVYGVFNKISGVLEAYSQQLPRARLMADGLNVDLMGGPFTLTQNNTAMNEAAH